MEENTLINNNGEINPEVDSSPNNDTKSYYDQAKEYARQSMSYINENKGTFSWVFILSVCILIIFILIGIFGAGNKNDSNITRKNITANGDCTIDGTLTVGGVKYNAGSGGDGTYGVGSTLVCDKVSFNDNGSIIKAGCSPSGSCIDFSSKNGYNFYVNTEIVDKNQVVTIDSDGLYSYTLRLNTESYITNGCATDGDKACIDFVSPKGYNFYAGTNSNNDAIYGSYNILLVNTDNVACNVDFKCYGDFYLGEITDGTGNITGNACKIYSNTYNNIIFGDDGSATINCSVVNTTSVDTSSDYRLKENIIPISDEYSVDKLNPCVYNLKDSGKLQTGFIAHELQEVFPHMVNGEKDGEDMQSVNYIQLIAILTKEIQDLKKRVLQLESK